MQNAFVESFNGRLRDECLNEHLFGSLKDAREIIEEWRTDYNTNRPHTSLNGLTPTEFAARPDQGQNGTELPYEQGQVGEQVMQMCAKFVFLNQILKSCRSIVYMRT